MKRINREGERYGQLTLLSRATPKNGKVVWECRCDCGVIKNIRWSHILGHTKSCGCLRRGKHLTHGGSSSPEYSVWLNMRRRCNNPRQHAFQHYGGRGIKICQRWDDFGNFFTDMGTRPKGYSLDRIDVEGNYEPSNCRWTSQAIQVRNIRPRKRLDQFTDAELLSEITRRGL